MRRVTRLRTTGVLILCAVVVGLLAALAVADPFHLRHARWFTSVLVGLALVLLTAAFAVAARRGFLRWLALLLGIVVILGWAGLVFGASRLLGPSREVSQVADGGRSLVILEGSAGAIEPVYAVVLRAGGGPFEQETVVYQGVEGSPPPLGVRFVDGDTVEVGTIGGCLYRSDVESVTLAVDPVHRPLLAGGC
jgi:hypothetical protein